MEKIASVISVCLALSIIPMIILVYKNHLSFIKGVILGAIAFVASFSVRVFTFSKMYGFSLIDAYINGVYDQLSQMSTSLSGQLPAEQLALFNNAITQVKNFYFAMFPSILVISCLLWSYLIFMIGKGIIYLLKKDTSSFLRFCDFRMAKLGIFLGIIAYAVSSFITQTRVAYGLLNFTAIIFSVTTVCGLSVIDYKLSKKIKLSIVRAIIYIIAFVMFGLVSPILCGVLAVIGTYDACFDGRKSKKKEE